MCAPNLSSIPSHSFNVVLPMPASLAGRNAVSRLARACADADHSPAHGVAAIVASVTRRTGGQSPHWTEKLLQSVALARHFYDARGAYREELRRVEGREKRKAQLIT